LYRQFDTITLLQNFPIYFRVMGELYEDKLKENLDWALREGSMHFDQDSGVHKTLRAITSRVDKLGISYAVVGGMAMFAHGYRRFTDDVDLLVTRESMDRIIQDLEGLGCVQPAGTSTKLRDTQTGVRIEFRIAGQFPGDGKPKPVAFPDPANVATEIGGIKFLNLQTLMQLKLASGISAPHRLKDLADVQELIRALNLPRTFADQLDPSVQPKFIELWDQVSAAPDEERAG
jgi:hypothetical protein